MRLRRRKRGSATATPQSLHGRYHRLRRGGDACPHRVTSRATRRRGPIISHTFADLLVPGVVVELDAREAEDLGAFEETALTDAEAWEANADLDMSEVARWRLNTSIRSPARSSSN